MKLFLSTYINNIDKKGRVSIPASFRNALKDESFKGVILFKSHKNQALEGWTSSRIEKISESLDNYDVFSSEQDYLATAIFSESQSLNLDADGRVTLPADMLEYIGNPDSIAFVGLGKTFQIWNPRELEAHKERSRTQLKKQGITIKLNNSN